MIDRVFVNNNTCANCPFGPTLILCAPCFEMIKIPTNYLWNSLKLDEHLLVVII